MSWRWFSDNSLLAMLLAKKLKEISSSSISVKCSGLETINDEAIQRDVRGIIRATIVLPPMPAYWKETFKIQNTTKYFRSIER